MTQYAINSCHPNDGCPTSIVDGGAIVIFWSPSVALASFRSISVHIRFRHKCKFPLKIFLNPLTSEVSIINTSENNYHTSPWPDQQPIVIIKHDSDNYRMRRGNCTISASGSKDIVNPPIQVIPIDMAIQPLRFESVAIYTQTGVYGDASENCKVTGPFTVTVLEGETAAAEAKFYASELHAERLANYSTSTQGMTPNNYGTRLNETEQDPVGCTNTGGEEIAVGDKETDVSDRERRVLSREEDVAHRERMVADREQRVAQREENISQRTQVVDTGQVHQDGSDGAPALSQNLAGKYPADYDEMEVAVDAWPTAVMLVLGGRAAVDLKKKYERLMDDWVRARGNSHSPDVYEYLLYSHGVAWPKLIPEDKFLAVRGEFKKLIESQEMK